MAVILTKEVIDGGTCYRFHSLERASEYEFLIGKDGRIEVISTRIARPYQGEQALMFMENFIKGTRSGEGFLDVAVATEMRRLIESLKGKKI